MSDWDVEIIDEQACEELASSDGVYFVCEESVPPNSTPNHAVKFEHEAQEPRRSSATTVVNILDEVCPPCRPPNQLFDMRVECTIPGRETELTLPWGTNQVFYRLEPQFGRNCVLSHRGKMIMKYMTPYKCAKELNLAPTSLSLKISTERQLKDEQLRMQLAEDGELDLSDAEPATELAADKKFPITLQGRSGSVRVLVSECTKIEELVRHYLQAKNVSASSPTARFDGDLAERTATVGALGIEEDDNLDIYT